MRCSFLSLTQIYCERYSLFKSLIGLDRKSRNGVTSNFFDLQNFNLQGLDNSGFFRTFAALDWNGRKKPKKKKRKRTNKGEELGPLVVCKLCAKHTRAIKTHLRYIHGIRTNISEYYYSTREWKNIRVQKLLERQEHERKRNEDPNHISCGTKINNSHFIKIIYTPMGGTNKKYWYRWILSSVYRSNEGYGVSRGGRRGSS